MNTISNNSIYDKNKDSLSNSKYIMNDRKGFDKKISNEVRGKRFKDKFAVITGAKGDFGRVCSERIAEEGGNLILWDLHPMDEIINNLKNKFQNQIFQSAVLDICKEEDVLEAAEKAYQDFQKIDLLFNNAGYQGDFKNTLEYTTHDFQKIMNINVVGAFIVIREIAKIMKQQKPQGGSIVNTASMAGIGAPPNMVAYASSKAAVKHMSVIASKDLAEFNIRVNSISPAFIGPGFMWTRQVELQAKAGSQFFSSDPNEVAKQMINEVPMKRYGTIDEVIDPVLFLLSDESSYITGTDIKITGGI